MRGVDRAAPERRDDGRRGRPLVITFRAGIVTWCCGDVCPGSAAVRDPAPTATSAGPRSRVARSGSRSRVTRGVARSDRHRTAGRQHSLPSPWPASSWHRGTVSESMTAGAVAAPAEWLTLPDIAEMFDVKVTRVHQMIRDRELIAARRDGVLRVPSELVTNATVRKHLPGVLTLL